MADSMKLETISQECREFEPAEIFKKKSHISSIEEYKKLYDKSIDNPESFWAEIAEELYLV